MFRSAGRFLSNPLAIAVVVVAMAVLGIAIAAGFIWRNGNKGPVAAPSSNDLRIYLTPSDGGAQSLSLANTDLAAPSLARFPLIYNAPNAAYLRLGQHLWGESSVMFSGIGFAGAWPDDDRARLVMQLNGPMKNADFSHCLAVKVNGEEVTRACGNGFSKFEFVPGGYTVEMGFQAPLSLEPSDMVEISFVLGTRFGEGETPVPNLVYGGDTPQRTSFLEIGGRLD